MDYNLIQKKNQDHWKALKCIECGGERGDLIIDNMKFAKWNPLRFICYHCQDLEPDIDWIIN